MCMCVRVCVCVCVCVRVCNDRCVHVCGVHVRRDTDEDNCFQAEF